MRTALLSLVTVAACSTAAGSAATTARPDQTVRVMGVGGGTSLTSDPSATHALAFSVQQVWLALPGAFDELGVPVQTLDPVKHRIGNEGFTAHHRLKNVPLSRYIDWGTSQMGQNADDYDVRLSFMAQAMPGDGGTTKLITTIDAAARPATYAQDYTQCTSKGNLEARLIELVKAKLAR